MLKRILSFLQLRWRSIVIAVALVALGAVLGAKLAGYAVKSNAPAESVEIAPGKPTSELLDEVDRLLNEVERRQEQRRQEFEKLLTSSPR